LHLTMRFSPMHTYIILTKRPQRMLEFFKYTNTEALPNVWLGVSCENQETANERIPLLLQVPAAVRFLSCEPLLGEINLAEITPKYSTYFFNCLKEPVLHKGYMPNAQGLINWVIVGGESGHNARPMHPDWARSLRNQCKDAAIPFFFKQWGEYKTLSQGKSVTGYKSHFWQDGRQAVQVGKKQAGYLLNGVEYRQMPEAGNEK